MPLTYTSMPHIPYSIFHTPTFLDQIASYGNYSLLFYKHALNKKGAINDRTIAITSMIPE